ncbi:Poly [ADP-ribose] polymerase 2 [Hypsizygus marmoreus]|uniref:Poly [ADP-ribose] polymerase n=1 Tax=Hypsizygus marmoreus TaxID=39966 RepID=A0A369K933_HYPMA|nr:Poly [ADP-ribose] polymerase 2 [Hypsizygus marmoreus]
MAPRKKAAADDTAPAPTRTSSRIKSQPAAPAAPVPPATAKASKKPKSKRARADSGSEDDAPAPKPASKKAKKTKKADEDAEDDMDEVAAPADQPADEPKKMVTVIKRGAAPVDPVSDKVATHQVYVNDEGVWDAMLNQTDVSGNSNKNKFYVLQLLHPIGNNSQCVLFTRWGRVGENGQTQVKGPWASATAIGEFKKQFRAKAAVPWEARVGMVAKKGKYTWLERDYNDEDDSRDLEKASSSKKEDVVIPDSTLASEIQELCQLIFSTSIIDAHLSSMNYDARKLPLGKLAKSTILNGFAALKTLAEIIESPSGAKAQEYGGLRAACEQLSGAYYSIIPHDFGRQRPIVIENAMLLKKELDLVDALGDMEIASKLISSTIQADENGKPLNPLDAHFRSLSLSHMEPIKSDSQEFKHLEAYARDTHGATHRHMQVTVMNAYRVERQSETAAWNAKGYGNLQDGERLLLWHGSRTTNFAGILKQGLRIAPPEAPVTGYMFGKGVYFADMMSKSANYCYSHLSGNTGLLLLCEVAARPFHELTDADYNADAGCKSNNKMCTKGIGRTQPVDWKDAGQALNNDELVGCHMPAGPGKDVCPPGAYLQYNEYIVYDSSQIRLKYLLMVRM